MLWVEMYFTLPMDVHILVIDGEIPFALGLRIYSHHATAFVVSAVECTWQLKVIYFLFRVFKFVNNLFFLVSQKVGYSSFQSVITAFVCFCIFGFILQLIIGGLWVVWIPMIFAFCFALGLRLHITNKENITECGTNPCLGEFCVGFWCWYCSVAQSKQILSLFCFFYIHLLN